MSSKDHSKEREARHELLNSVVTLAEAALTACLATARLSPPTVSEGQRNAMAHFLSRMLTVYTVGDNRSALRPVTRDDIGGGAFTDGGRIIAFQDDREPITDLVVLRTSLKTAIDVMNSVNHR